MKKLIAITALALFSTIATAAEKPAKEVEAYKNQARVVTAEGYVYKHGKLLMQGKKMGKMWQNKNHIGRKPFRVAFHKSATK
jgi:hypothetical protein